MRLLKVASLNLNQTPLDWEGNRQRIEEGLDAAREQAVTVACLPELCISGYGCEDAFHAPGVHQTALEMLEALLPTSRGMVVCLGLPFFYQRAVYNVVALLVNGELVGIVPKRHLAGDGLHYEPRWFRAWPRGEVAEAQMLGHTVPFGDLMFDLGGVGVGFEICEEAWVADRPGRSMDGLGLDLILSPNASHFAFHKSRVRRRFVLEGSRAFHCAYVYANLLGNEAGRVIYDGGGLIANAGEMVASGERFGFTPWQLTTAVVDLDRNRVGAARQSGASSDLRRRDEYVVVVPYAWPQAKPESHRPDESEWEHSGARKEEEFTRAVTLGLFDYMRKSRSRGFVVSISGGADSAAVCCLIGLMVQRGVAELGRDGFAQALAYIPELADAETDAERTALLLTAVYQATRNSSATTFEAARGVAEALGAQFHRFEVDSLVETYTALAAEALGRELTWERDDLALQNIQARVRAPSVWMLANLRGALLLSTSNRSEAAVGYATMDGDTSGGLCPIAGIDKAFLRHWLRWLESEGPHGLGPIPALTAINVQAPTAELRPGEASQTDEDDLMPYPLLDAIERAAIRDKQMPDEIFETMQLEFTDYEPRQLASWIERFFRLWSRNQWKRERYAPSFHVDDENLDPKTWCRFPILSGGFEHELKQMWAKLEGE